MEKERPEITDVIYFMRNHVLERLGSKKRVLPVSQDAKSSEQIYDEFINLKGVDVLGHAFFEAGFVFACTQILEIMDRDVLNKETWKGSMSDHPESQTENGKSIPQDELEKFNQTAPLKTPNTDFLGGKSEGE